MTPGFNYPKMVAFSQETKLILATEAVQKN